MSSERPENNKNENPCFKIYSFLRSEDATKFKIDSVDRALLHAIVGYIGMSNERVCKARHDAIMKDAGIKNKTCYVKHLRKLQDLRLIKTIRKWKMNLHYMGDYFIHYEENKPKNSGALNVPDNSDVNIKDAKRTSSGTLNVPHQVLDTYSTIDIEKKENEKKERGKIHSRSKIELSTEKKQKSGEIKPPLFDEIKLNSGDGEVSAGDFKSNSKEWRTCPSPAFLEFIENYPKKTRYKECLKFWHNNKLDEISHHINQDLKNRLLNHAPWLRNFKAGTVQYIPNPFDHLLHERWHEPIIPLTEYENEKLNQARSTHDNKNRPCLKKQQDSFFCRLHERIKEESESTTEAEISIRRSD